MSVSKCLKKLKISSEDAGDIREFIRKYRNPDVGAQEYINSLDDDINDLKSQLESQGFDIDHKIVDIKQGNIPKHMMEELKT